MHMGPNGHALSETLTTRLYAEAHAERWQLTPERFRAVLEASLAHTFTSQSSSDREREAYVRTLRLEDLALATACADGHQGAWEHFIRELRPVLYRSADAIDPSGGARDLADSIYGELFGVTEQAGARRSLFRYFHGRSSLATWIRSVLSQRHVDRERARRRTDALPDDESPAALAAPAVPPDPDRTRWMALVHLVLGAAIAALDARDRLRLAWYYGQGLKLAAIGGLLGEHEATVSRHLARTRRDIRAGVERRLRGDHHLSDLAIAECLAAAVADAGMIDLSEVIDQSDDRKNPELDRSKVRGGRGVEEG